MKRITVRSLPIALAAVMALPILGASSVAEAEGVHVRVGASIRIGAPRVRVRPHRVRRVFRPYRQRHRHHLHVGGGLYFGYGVRFAQPPPPRCDWECGVQPIRTYYSPAPRPVVVQQPIVVSRPSRPAPARWGLGVFAGSMDVEGQEAGSDIGLIGRFRLTPHVALEGEIAKSELANGDRIDRRLGGALLYDFSPWSKVSPYILAGAGVSQADLGGGRYSADQAYGELGIGLAYRLTPRFEIAGDIRAGVREADGDDVVFLATEPQPIQEDESFTRARLSVILYF